MGWYLLVVVDTQPCTAVTIPDKKGSLAKGSWHAVGVTEGFTAGTFPKVQTYVETCHPAESPRFGYAKPPPFDKGGFGLCTYCTAVTIPGGFREQ